MANSYSVETYMFFLIIRPIHAEISEMHSHVSKSIT